MHKRDAWLELAIEVAGCAIILGLAGALIYDALIQAFLRW